MDADHVVVPEGSRPYSRPNIYRKWTRRFHLLYMNDSLNQNLIIRLVQSEHKFSNYYFINDYCKKRIEVYSTSTDEMNSFKSE